MGNFFKNLGKGIGYFFAFPGLIIAIALYAVVGIFVFIFQFFKLIFLFFTGRTLSSDLPEDIELKNLQNKPVEEEKEQDNQLSLYPSDSIVYSSDYSSPIVEEKNEEPTQEVVPLDVLDNNEYDNKEGGEN